MATVTPAPPRRSRERTAYGQLVLLAFLWAVNWPLMKLILPSVPPVTLLILRFFGAAAIAVVIAALVRQPLLPLRGERLQLGFIGLFQIAINMSLGTIGLQYVGAGRAVVLVYTMQLWALPIAWLILKERMTAIGWLGGIIGFSGLVLFLNPTLVDWNDRRVLTGDLMILISAVVWAVGSSLYRLRRWQTPMWSQVFWQCLWSGLSVALYGWVAGIHHHVEWSALVIGVLVFNWLLAASAAYWLWNQALSVLPVAKAGQVISLVPVLAVTMSAIFMHEPIGALGVLSIALILCGIFVTVRSKSPA